VKKQPIRFLVGASLWMVCFIGGVSAQTNTTVYDKDVRVVDFADLKYPAVAYTANYQGVVVVRIKLDDHGKPVDAVALSGPELLIHDCVENAKKWRFEPNSQKTVILVYSFRIEGTCHDNTELGQFIFHWPNFATITACGMTPVP
jgi:hypothetical protein